jgi:tetratricopeptide (TPR) repeat protein
MRIDSSHHGPKFALAVALSMALTACATTATRTAPAPTPELVRRFVLDYEHVPAPPDGLTGEVRDAWQALRAGDDATAQRLVDTATASGAGIDTVGGFLLLARGATTEARSRFQRALAAEPGDAPALYGLGFVAEAEGDRESGLDWYRQAVAADPTLSPAAVRLQVLRLEEAQALIAEGERAEAAGEGERALASYEAALELAPDVLEPYLRIAAIESRGGRHDAAVRTLRAARDRVGELRLVLEPLGQALQASSAYAEAYDVFQALQEVAPDDPAVRAQVAAAREMYFTTSLPEPYRELESKAEITREDLAALIAIRLESLADLVDEPRTGVIVVDIDDSWARDYIREVVQWGVMQVFQNHGFQPDLVVKRQAFAEVAYRILDLLGATENAPRARLTDVATEHYFYDQIGIVVGLGILELGPRGSFGLLDPVSGAEAVDAVQRLVRLARSGGER